MCEHASESYESDAKLRTDTKLYDTGGGYLVFSVRMEYHRMFEEWFPVRSTVIGVSDVEDWRRIKETLRELDIDPGITDELNRLSIEEKDIMNRSDDTE